MRSSATSERVARESPPRFYFGWYLAGTAMLATALSSSTAQVFMGTMLKPITEDLGWSRAAVSGAVTLGTFTSGLLSPLMGRLADRHGPRLLMAGGAAIVALALFCLAAATELWQFYLAYLFGRGLSSSTLSGVVPATAITNWFRRRRGRVMGFLMMSMWVGASAIVLIGQWLTESVGWRATFQVFAVATLVVVVPPSLLFLRRRPEDIGQLPDGDPPGSTDDTTTKRAPEPSWTFREALRTRALWLITIGLSLCVMSVSGVGFHQVPYYTDLGIAPALAAVAVSIYTITGAIASPVWGYLGERVEERRLTAAAMWLASAVVCALIFVRSPVAAILCAAMFGVAARGESMLVNLLLGEYYGRGSFGTINGFVLPFSQTALGFGPLFAALLFELTGSYQPGFVIFASCFALGGVLVWLARKPIRPDATPA